jgi:hypothetical protein
MNTAQSGHELPLFGVHARRGGGITSMRRIDASDNSKGDTVAPYELFEWGEEGQRAPEYVILNPPTDSHPTDRLAFSRTRYHRMVTAAQGMREADTATDEFGSTVFHAAGIVDGTLVGSMVSRGPSRRRASLRIDNDGKWSSKVTSGPVTTEAHGQLGTDDPIKMRRTRIRDGEVIWTADAVTDLDVTTEDGSRIPRRTTGTIKYPNGGKGKFQTDYLGVADDEPSRQSTGTWHPVPGGGPGKTGKQVTTTLPGGPGNTQWQRTIRDEATGGQSVETRIERQGMQDDGFHIEGTDRKDVEQDGHTSSIEVKDHQINGDAGTSWTRETTRDGVTTETQSGTFTVNGTAASDSRSTVHADGSITIQTTTWDTETGRGQRETTEVKTDGTSTTTTKQGKADAMKGMHRPGDTDSDFFEADDDTNDDTDDDTDDDTGDDTDDDSDNGGGDETESPDDPYGDDDTGGYPGMGWDGGANGPLELLPPAARAAMGRFNDPNHPIDSMGDDSALAELLAAAFAEAARRPGPSDSGHGEDTGDPLHGVSEETLARAARNAPPVDPEWGDWSNPKAHAVFADHFGLNIVTEVGRDIKAGVITGVDIEDLKSKIEVGGSLTRFATPT